MTIKTSLSCPLGHKCEEIKGSEISKCAWYIKIAGAHPETGDLIDEFGCAMSWIPVLLVENANSSRSTASAVESFRNEMVATNNQLLAYTNMARIGS